METISPDSENLYPKIPKQATNNVVMGPSNFTSRRSDDRIDWEDPSNARVKFADRFLNALIRNTWQSDMSFFLESTGTTIPAHTQIVSVASPVLERMCFNSFGANSDEPAKPTVISVPAEYSAKVFSVVLEYLYSGTGVCKINEENAIQVMLLADFFDLLDLQNQMTSILEGTLNESNVCAIYDQVHGLCNNFVPICLDFISNNAQSLFVNGTIMRMQESAVKLVLDQDSLDIENESIAILSMIDWAKAECCRLQLSPNPEHMRELLEPFIYAVRFPTMNINQFMVACLNLGSNFLSSSEISEIMRSISDNGKESATQELACQFSIVPRTSMFEEKVFTYELQELEEEVSHEDICIEIPAEMGNNVRLTGFGIDCDSEMIPFVITTKCGLKVIQIDFTVKNRQVVFVNGLKPIDNICSFQIFSLCTYATYEVPDDKSKPCFKNARTAIDALTFKMPIGRNI